MLGFVYLRVVIANTYNTVEDFVKFSLPCPWALSRYWTQSHKPYLCVVNTFHLSISKAKLELDHNIFLIKMQICSVYDFCSSLMIPN